jgi:hypothetical protein
MSIFRPEKLQKISREMAGQRGIEKSPKEWEEEFYDWIRMVRQEKPEETKSMTDDEVWEQIVIQVKKLPNEG